MYRLSLMTLMGAVTTSLMALGMRGTADDNTARAAADSKTAPVFMNCAKACDDCKRSCDICAAHCAQLVADGHKHHMATLKTCQDCAATCSAAGCIVAKQGPFSDIICQACADACKRCGDACEQHGKGDPVMKQCADECRKCEEVCRKMLKQVPKAPAPEK